MLQAAIVALALHVVGLTEAFSMVEFHRCQIGLDATFPASLKCKKIDHDAASVDSYMLTKRRKFLLEGLVGALIPPMMVFASASASTAATDDAQDLAELRKQVIEARKQLDPVPDLIKKEQWDSVRAILIVPPISGCWGKGSGTRPLLQRYAEAIGDKPKGDELAALEAKEEVISHLRFLDMAVYNNVFNPIKAEGETGASKALVQSYYEDPINELKASTLALDELIQLGNL